MFNSADHHLHGNSALGPHIEDFEYDGKIAVPVFLPLKKDFIAAVYHRNPSEVDV